MVVFSVRCALGLALLAGLVQAEERKGAAATWQPLGPAPIESSGNNNIVNIGTNDPASGAIHAIAAHPTNPNVAYIGAVNGGIWKTTNATALSPSWVQQTDERQSSSIGDVVFDPADSTHQTLVAGFGRFSSFGFSGGSRDGLIRTTNGGATWNALGAAMQGRNVAKIAANGNIIVAAVDTADFFGCSEIGIFRSVDAGATWAAVTNGISNGSSDALAQHPANPAILYASMTDLGGRCAAAGDGIFRSSDTGASWSKVSSPAMDALIQDLDSFENHFEIAVGPTGAVYVAIVPGRDAQGNGGGRLAGVFRSGNGGASWQQMDLPGTNEPGFQGIHPGGQGAFHSSLAVDPFADNLVYIGGDRQPNTAEEVPGGPPNASGACSFGGRIFRGNANAPAGSQWVDITHNGADPDGVAATSCQDANGTAPHPDSRDMAFDANGNLLESDDGGIYRRQNPRNNTGIWVDVNGDLQVTEQHSGQFDRNSGLAISGNQDNGTSSQRTAGSLAWDSNQGGDGGDVVIDTLTIPNFSVRYVSFQNLGTARRLQYDSAGNFVGGAQLALTIVSGTQPLTPQFVTPLATNRVQGGRLIIGARNGLYESFDRGDTLFEIGPGITANNSSSIAYGVAGNAEQLFVAAGSQAGIRTQANGPLNLVYDNPAAGVLAAVAMDPSDGSRLFVLENSAVQFSSNGGGQFSNVTGALIANFDPGTLRTITFMERPDDAIAVGADRGVYIATASGGFSNWAEAGTGLPTAQVRELDYDPATDTLVAFTLGRGSFALTGGGGGVAPQQFCSTPGAAIPDNSGAGLSDGLPVPATGRISNLTVTLQVSHTYVGDLRATLRNGSTGTQITLLDQPGVPALDAFGCAGDNIDAVLADASGLAVENQCANLPAIGGTVRPDQALAAFNNEAIGGTWTLNISDNAEDDTGSLSRWCLQATLDGGSSGQPLIFEDSFEN